VSERGERYDLDRLRAAFAEPDEAGEPRRPDHCPSPAEIWAGVHGELSPGRLRDVVEHLASCSSCAEAWRVALILERPADALGAAGTPAEVSAGTGGARRAPRRPSNWRLYGMLAAAAAAVFAVVLGIHDLRRGEAPPPVIVQRGGPAEPHAATRWLTPGEATLPRDGARLRWSGPPDATYDLRVELVDEREAAEPIAIATPRGLTATEYTLTVRDLARLPAGAALRAALTAHLPDGRSEHIFLDFRLQ
jgi:Putative zinc-finger